MALKQIAVVNVDRASVLPQPSIHSGRLTAHFASLGIESLDPETCVCSLDFAGTLAAIVDGEFQIDNNNMSAFLKLLALNFIVVINTAETMSTMMGAFLTPLVAYLDTLSDTDYAPLDFAGFTLLTVCGTGKIVEFQIQNRELMYDSEDVFHQSLEAIAAESWSTQFNRQCVDFLHAQGGFRPRSKTSKCEIWESADRATTLWMMGHFSWTHYWMASSKADMSLSQLHAQLTDPSGLTKRARLGAPVATEEASIEINYYPGTLKDGIRWESIFCTSSSKHKGWQNLVKSESFLETIDPASVRHFVWFGDGANDLCLARVGVREFPNLHRNIGVFLGGPTMSGSATLVSPTIVVFENSFATHFHVAMSELGQLAMNH